MSNVIKPSEPSRLTVEDYGKDRIESHDAPSTPSDLDPKVILAEAREEAERKVREAYEEGLRRGLEAGQTQFEESVGQAAQMLERAAQAMEHARQSFLESLEPQLVELAVMVAERIIEREVRLDPGAVETTARAALARVVDEERVALHVHPGDIDCIRDRRPDLLERFDRIETIEIVADDTVDSGGCIARTDALEIDASLRAQLEQVMVRLLSQDSTPGRDDA